MAEDLGSIYIEVELETAKLLTGVNKANQGIDSLSGGMEGVTKATDSAEKSMLSFSKVAQLVAGSLTAGAVIKAVDDWGQMAARIKMALNSVEGDVSRYAEIQERFLEVSNRNGKAIETTQALYAGSATSMKELGYNTTQTVDYIESLSSTFTANATSAQQTESAMNALNRAMVTGTLSGNDWHSVLNAIPTTVGDIAKELSRMRGGIQVTEREVKQMAANGGIDMKLFADAMINAKDANNALADSMDNTIADGFTKLANSAKAYYGELNQTYGVTRSASAGFAVLSDNFDKVADAANIAAIVVGARMANSLALAGKEQLKSITNGIAQAKANAATAESAQYAASAIARKAFAEKEAALSAMALAQAEYNVAKGSSAEMLALDALNAAKTRGVAASIAATQAERGLALATAASSAAARAASVSFRLMSGALALVGGPVGVAVIAAATLYSWYEGAKRAKEEAIAFANGLDQLSDSMRSMNNVQLRGVIADASQSMRAQQEEIESLESEIKTLRLRYKELSPEVEETLRKHGTLDAQLRINQQTSERLAQAERDLAEKKEKLARTSETAEQATNQLNSSMRSAMGIHDDLTEKGTTLEMVQGAVARAFGNTADEINRANQAGQNFKPASLQISPATEEGDKLILSLEEQNRLLKIKDDRTRAITKAEIDQSKKTDNKNQIERAKQIAGENYDLQQSQDKVSKSTGDATTKSDEAAQSLSRLQTQLDRLNTGYAEGSLELAKYDAVQALGANASAQQKAAAEAQAASIWEVQRAVKAASDAEQKRQQAAQNFTGLQSQSSPVFAVDNQFQQQMQQLNEYATLYPQKIAEVEAVRASIEDQYRQQRMAAQWQELSQMSLGYNMLTSAVDSLAGNASNAITGLMTGTMSAQDAMRSLGNTVLNSVVNSIVQVGVEMLKNFILAQTVGVASQAANTAAATAGGAAALAAWTPAAIAASIATAGAASGTGLAAYSSAQASGAALSVIGARKNGGPVSANQMYRIGEGGMPEIYQASNGSQYMIPGDNGKVISNKDMQGGVNVVINVTNNTPAQAQFTQSYDQQTNTLTIQQFISDMQQKGPMHRSITQNTSATTKL